jgi:phosphatidylglycerol:prolipoprotein diacylglycerol transferase
MLTYPDIDPVAFSIGPLDLHWFSIGQLDVHWYGLTYLVGFIGGWWLGRWRAARADSGWTAHEVDELVFYMALGVVLGGRIGYILFYSLNPFLDDPLILFRIKEGGMSFHGGLLGVMLALWFFGRRFKRPFFACTDFIAPLAPVGLGAGRIGNFINGELWGKPADLPWAMQLSCSDFPRACRELPMDSLYSPALHPSQLYEASLEGLALFLILWFYSARPRPLMAVSGLFLLCYGLFRFAVEFVRVPDIQIGYLAFDWVTMGQVLSLPMLLGGLVLLTMAYSKK